MSLSCTFSIGMELNFLAVDTRKRISIGFNHIRCLFEVTTTANSSHYLVD